MAPNVEGEYEAVDADYELSSGSSGIFSYETTITNQTVIGGIEHETTISAPVATSQESYISGSGDNFTIWSKTYWDTISQRRVVEIISGTLLPSGDIVDVEEFHLLIHTNISWWGWIKIWADFTLVP